MEAGSFSPSCQHLTSGKPVGMPMAWNVKWRAVSLLGLHGLSPVTKVTSVKPASCLFRKMLAP